ncbi:unnamed protein product [Orchesella dallaii]|uniref:Uncharacterized protein n=1 Tax=Orchesella dallaii TaxID=48710 RepID=A0ABP1R7Q2_9HEXA
MRREALFTSAALLIRSWTLEIELKHCQPSLDYRRTLEIGIATSIQRFQTCGTSLPCFTLAIR